MSQRRTTTVWIACFAVLFSLLAMPLSPSTPRVAGEQVLWGTFCGGGGTRLVAIPLIEASQGMPDGQQHQSAMQHCPCCSGSVFVVIAPGFSHGLVARLEPERFAPAIFLIHASPRLQWPSANPRASPPV
ncbi:MULTISPECIES: DUF2946 domain-containing protein [Pseudomonas syringae group]|uniref:DUF2946 domain-containing protein n=1 Tax=Pseudomonas syringae group TaxID=136849 RepID=UPI0005B6EBB8|nr:DUF2946 domain-containing protein [Pseudomonas viridiflava]MBD8568409.1 DUF2946 domain-containing protein [Pseudomonas syringae]KIQ32964.1 hypothetical protein RT94_14845 [Pseudomonas viridiflava]MBD8808716.1 DUF2946 domain-containing protein [Pseudomonas syringae]MBI6705009.1 DUF2946 domain-containing protein [Pseudomonas viridiflava]MBI6723209.1 DUF2946 domain-containing protein [Pseudomonas viridiflava]